MKWSGPGSVGCMAPRCGSESVASVVLSAYLKCTGMVSCKHEARGSLCQLRGYLNAGHQSHRATSGNSTNGPDAASGPRASTSNCGSGACPGDCSGRLGRELPMSPIIAVYLHDMPRALSLCRALNKINSARCVHASIVRQLTVAGRGPQSCNLICSAPSPLQHPSAPAARAKIAGC